MPLQRKKFEIRAVDQPDKLTLYSGCDDKSKLLLGLCRDTHQFTMAIAPRVNEAKRREEEGQFDLSISSGFILFKVNFLKTLSTNLSDPICKKDNLSIHTIAIYDLSSVIFFNSPSSS